MESHCGGGGGGRVVQHLTAGSRPGRVGGGCLWQPEQTRVRGAQIGVCNDARRPETGLRVLSLSMQAREPAFVRPPFAYLITCSEQSFYY